ncbi:hypothetical protein ACFLUX_02505 [Chloroflexota bacterium]
MFESEETPKLEVEAATILSKPLKELATKLLDKVDYIDRLVLYSMTPKACTQTVIFSSLGEVLKFLHGYESSSGDDEVLAEENLVNVRYIDLKKLQKWIDETLGDQELAKAIREEIGQECNHSNFQDIVQHFNKHISPVKTLIEKRIKQCNQVAIEASETK